MCVIHVDSKTLHQRMKSVIQNPEPYSTVYSSNGTITHYCFPKAQEIHDPPMVIYPLKHQYISNKIWGRRIDDFFAKPDSAMFIDAQTGSGKTHFIFNELHPRLHKLYQSPQYSCLRGEPSMLILANRTLLKQQVKLAAMEVAGTLQKENLTAIGVSREHHFGNIDIYTYQDLDVEANRKYLAKAFESHKYSVIIYDECHYFFSDADFNPLTESHFDFLLGKAIRTHVPRIYMTSTPEYVLDEIARKEAEFATSRTNYHPAIYSTFSQSQLQYYYFARDYHYLKVCFFDEENLVELIKSTPERNVLVFIESKSYGQSIINELKSNGIDSCFLLDANSIRNGSKESETIKNTLSEKNELDVRVLLATKCLDVGVTIKTKNLSIFCFLKDKVDFLQAIGRKRVSGSETVNLYIPSYTGRDIGNYARKLYCTYTDMVKALDDYPDREKAYGSAFPMPIYVDHGVYHHNSFSLRKLELQLQELHDLQNRLKSCEKNESAEIEMISKHILSWMELEDTFSPDMIDSSKYVKADKGEIRDKIMTMLKKYQNTIFEENQFQCLCGELDRLGLDPRKDTRPERRNWTTQTVNKVLKTYDINYVISSKNRGTYQFSQKEV